MSDRLRILQLQSIESKIQYLVYGFFRIAQLSLFNDQNINHHNIPNVAILICLHYYYDDTENEQQSNTETNALLVLHHGELLLKYPRRSGCVHFKHVELSTDNLRLQWYSKRKPRSSTCIWIKDINELIHGQDYILKKHKRKSLEKASFCIMYQSNKNFTFCAKSEEQYKMWTQCIMRLLKIYKNNKNEDDLRRLNKLYVDVVYTNRFPREKSNNFIRTVGGRINIDLEILKQIECEMKQIQNLYKKTVELAQTHVQQIKKTNQYSNIKYHLNECEKEIECLQYEIANVTDTELTTREVWITNVHLISIKEKIDALILQPDSVENTQKCNTIFY
eukprot:412121_1